MTNDRLVFSAVAVPNEPDWDGEILTPEEIRYAAHKYMKDYRVVDPDHTCALGECVTVGDPVESYILNDDIVVKAYDGSTIDLPKGSWIIGIDVTDDQVYQEIKDGVKKGVSLTAKRNDADGVIKSKRVLIRDLGKEWVARTVSIVNDPAVPKARFFYRNESDSMTENDELMSGFDKIVAAIKSLRSDADPQDQEEEIIEDVVEDQEETAEDDDVVKSADDSVEDDEEAVDQEEDEAIKFVTHDELAATKSQILDVIKSVTKETESVTVEDLQKQIADLQKEIADLKGKLTSVKSKAIPDHYQEKEEVVKGYDADDRDLYGRVIR